MPTHRHPYTEQEDSNMLEYIIKSRAYYRLRGIAFWREMEEAKITQNRSYQSLKERFRKCIIKNLKKKHCYDALDEDERNNIKVGYRTTAAKKTTKGKVRMQKCIQEDDSFDDEMSGYRLPYSRQEEVDILKFIIENDAYYRLRGRAIWQEMEKAGVGKQRTHQSLKEHFRKFMANRLNKNYYGIVDEKLLMKIKQGYVASAVGAADMSTTEEKKQADLSKTPPTSDSDDTE